MRVSLKRCRRADTGVAKPVHDPCNASGPAVHDSTDLPTSEVHDPSFSAPIPAPAPSPWDTATDAQRDTARRRLRIVVRAEEFYAGGAPRVRADAMAAAEAGVSASAVASWRRRVGGLERGGRVQALLDAPGRGRRSGTEDEAVRGLVAALVLGEGRHLTAAHAQRVLVARYGSAPSVRTVARWIERYRQEQARTISVVEHPDRHRSRRMPAGGDKAAGVEGLNALWELDSTPADVMCAVPGSRTPRRYAVVAGIDVWSRRARVLVVPTSRATAIAALMRRCLVAWGVPEAARTDEGKDYTSVHLRRVLADLEIRHDACPPYTPEGKPFVERFIGTLSRDLFAHLPGFTGHDVAQAQALRSRKSFARRRGEQDAETFAVSLTAEELQSRCDAWCESVYGRRPHEGLGGETPFSRAASWSGEVRRIREERALDALLAAPAGDGWRVVQKKGIAVEGGVHIAAELGPLVGERVQVRQDPADLGRIHVYRANGAFVCVACDPVRTGIDRAGVAAEMKALAKRADGEGRRYARELKREHRPEAVMDEVLAWAVGESERVVALPRSGTAHETPALREAAKAGVGERLEREKDRAAAAGRRGGHGRALKAAAKLYLQQED